MTPLPDGSGSYFARLGNQRFNPVADLSAYTRPVFNAFQVKAKTLFLTARYRIEKTQTLDVAAIARFTTICHNDVVERLLFRAAA